MKTTADAATVLMHAACFPEHMDDPEGAHVCRRCGCLIEYDMIPAPIMHAQLTDTFTLHAFWHTILEA